MLEGSDRDDIVCLARRRRGKLSLDVAEDADADALVRVCQTPLAHQRLALFRLERFLRAVDPARAESQRVRRIHEIPHDKAPVFHGGGDGRVRQHEADRRRAVKRLCLGIAEHGGVHPLQLRDILRLLQDDDLAIDFEALGLSKDRRREEDERAAETKLRQYATGKGNRNVPQLKTLAIGLPVLTAAAAVAAAVGLVSWMMVLYLFFAQLLASVLFGGALKNEKDSIMVLARRLDRVEERIRVLQEPAFESGYLREMQRQLADAGEGIRALNRIVGAWQMRENFVLYLPLVGLLAWDFNCCLALDGWRQKYGVSFGRWMDWIGEVEALYSLGTLSRVRPDETTLPEIVASETPFLEMEDGKHPLLDPRTVIGNDYSQGGDTVIITGSNMSGKSTFMRTLALNAVLAYAGGTVMAKNFRISPMRIFTSMRVRDDVSEGISSFYGEILRIKQMVAWSEQEKPMLVLVDEIFKGTNSADRIIGAEAAIKKLSRPWMMTIVTTHDFELCALADSPEVGGKNYHFEEHYDGDTIAFDYKIRPGRCRTTNAQHLMRIAGLLDAEQQDGEKEEAHVL